MKTKNTQNTLKTSYGWATQLKVDRAVLTRKLHGVRPDGRRGKFDLYSLKTIRDAMEKAAAGKREKRGLSDELLHERIRSIEIRNRIADGSLIPVSQVCGAISTRMAEMNSALNQKLVNELPAIVAGLPIGEIRLRATLFISELMSTIHELQRDLELKK